MWRNSWNSMRGNKSSVEIGDASRTLAFSWDNVEIVRIVTESWPIIITRLWSGYCPNSEWLRIMAGLERSCEVDVPTCQQQLCIIKCLPHVTLPSDIRTRQVFILVSSRESGELNFHGNIDSSHTKTKEYNLKYIIAIQRCLCKGLGITTEKGGDN